MDLCPHGNPQSLPCKLCHRVGDVPAEMLGVVPPVDLTPFRQLLAHAFGLLDAVDPKKAGPDWVASYEEWKTTWQGIDPSATIVASPAEPVEAAAASG